MSDEAKVVELPIEQCDLKVRVGRDGVWLEFGKNAAIHVHNTLGQHGGIVASAVNQWCIARQEQAAAFREANDSLRLLDVPQRLYSSEINFSLACFYDGGFSVKIGDDMNGFDAEATVQSYNEALSWLDEQARERFPESLYATGKHPEGWLQDGEVSARGA